MKAAIAVLALLASFQVQAKDGKDPFAVCKADFERLCKNVQAGDGRIMQCMIEKKSSLSSGCAELISKKQAREAQMHKNKNKDKVKS